MENIYPQFKSLAQYTFELNKRNYPCFVTLLDRETTDFSHILGERINIDGVVYRGKFVERFLHAPPWRKGEKISIVVEEL